MRVIRTKSQCPGCGCQQRVLARDISAVIHKGSLLGTTMLEPSDPRRKLSPLQYDSIEFCARPTCERVFRASRKQDEVAAEGSERLQGRAA